MALIHPKHSIEPHVFFGKTFIDPSLKTEPPFDPASLFKNGEQGFWYDPNDMGTMFQDFAGTIPVTGAGQPVGLMLDKSKELVLGDNYLTTDTLDFTSWSGTANVTAKSKNSFTAGGVGGYYKGFQELLGKAIRVRLKGRCGVSWMLRNSSNLNGAINVPAGEFDVTSNNPDIFKNSASMYFIINGASTFTLDSISVDELKGNHAYQTTSASRPILQQTPLLASNLLPAYDFRTWSTVGTPSPLTANSFTTSATGGVRTGILKPNTSYVVELDIENTSNVGIYHGANANTTIVSGTRRKVLVQVTTDTGTVFYLRNAAAGTTTVYSIKVQEITGYRTDQNYIEYNPVDDKLIANLPTQLTDCTVIRSVPSVGTQILTNQTIPATYEDNQNHCGLIVINRALTPNETSAIATEFNKRAGV